MFRFEYLRPSLASSSIKFLVYVSTLERGGSYLLASMTGNMTKNCKIRIRTELLLFYCDKTQIHKAQTDFVEFHPRSKIISRL